MFDLPPNHRTGVTEGYSFGKQFIVERRNRLGVWDRRWRSFCQTERRVTDGSCQVLVHIPMYYPTGQVPYFVERHSHHG